MSNTSTVEKLEIPNSISMPKSFIWGQSHVVSSGQDNILTYASAPVIQNTSS